jgi:hypothetical protein
MRALILLVLLATTALADPTPDQLAKDRLDAASKVYTHAEQLYKNGLINIDALMTWSIRWVDAALDAPKPNAKTILADHLQRMQDAEALVAKRVAAGAASSVDSEIAAYCRLEAQLWVARGKK